MDCRKIEKCGYFKAQNKNYLSSPSAWRWPLLIFDIFPFGLFQNVYLYLLFFFFPSFFNREICCIFLLCPVLFAHNVLVYFCCKGTSLPGVYLHSRARLRKEYLLCAIMCGSQEKVSIHGGTMCAPLGKPEGKRRQNALQERWRGSYQS